MIKLIKLLKKLQERLVRKAIIRTEARLRSVAECRDLVDELAEKRIEMADKLYEHLLERAEIKHKAGVERVEQVRKAAAEELNELQAMKAEV